jgi:hypothetical protein
VKGRYIGEAIRTTSDIIEWANNNNRVGILLLIDFRKAFDCIAFKHIDDSLEFFGFGIRIRSWVKVLLNNFKASINHAGNISREFTIGRGCRQGDPISSLLFILSIESLCIKLRASRIIKAFSIYDRYYLLSLYADDVTIFMEYDEQSLREVIKILKEFRKLSGLDINLQKTQCVKFGKNSNLLPNTCQDLNLVWDQRFKLLGVSFNCFTNDLTPNIDEKLAEMEKIASNWKYRLMTPIGRAAISKSLILSKLNHLAFMIPKFPTNSIKRIESIIFNFIWRGRDKVARIDAQQPWEKGGLNLPDVKICCSSFKFSWIKRLLYSEGSWVDLFVDSIRTSIPNFNKEDLCELIGTRNLTRALNATGNQFWKNVFEIATPLGLAYLKNKPVSIIFQFIWGNAFVKRNGNPISAREFNTISHLKTIYEFINVDAGGHMSIKSLGQIMEIAPNLNNDQFISFRLLLTHLLTEHRLLNNNYTNHEILSRPFRPLLIEIVNLQTKGCSGWTKIFKTYYGVRSNVRSKEIAWHAELNSTRSVNSWNNTYRLTKSIFFDNKIKWLQFQINRNSLKTNRIVSNFTNRGIECDYCNLEAETVSHLFWDCNITNRFIVMVVHDWSTRLVNLNFTKSSFIFGGTNHNINNPNFVLSLYIKRYIWREKFLTKHLEINNFNAWLNKEILLCGRAFPQKNTFRILTA